MVLPEDRIRKYKDEIRNLSNRQQGESLIEMIRKLIEVIRGFSNYFKVRNVKRKFKRLDEWIQMRVRTYMREEKVISNPKIKKCIFIKFLE